MKRKAYANLVEWRKNPGKAMLLRGARQTGKTYLIKSFAGEYEKSLYLNLEDEPQLVSMFESSRNADTIYTALSLEKGFTVNPEEPRPLLIIDEIQASGAAYSALKPLVIDGRCDVLASGSLLGVLLNDKFLSPEGYVTYLDIMPMDFEEYLWATGVDEDSTRKIRKMIAEENVPESVRKSVEKAYSNYLIIGGMPAAVEEFSRSKDYSKVWEIHSDIIENARGDVMKYAPHNLKLRILACFDSIPRILAKENRTFRYSDIENRAGYGSREYDPALNWIEAAGLVYRCFNLSDVCEPLKQHERSDSFKMYMSDQGLLTHMFGAETTQAIARGDVYVNRGAVMESATAQALWTAGFQIHFYSKKDSTLETDFVISYKEKVTALEVKSGVSKRSKSMKMLLSGDYRIERGIKVASCKTETDENGILHLPLFAPSFLEQSQEITIDTPDVDEINHMLKEQE